jgi:hypothetical protein
MSPASDSNQPLSCVLEGIAGSENDHVSVKDLVSRLGGRALGALLLIFGLLCVLPLPPGATTLFGAPLLIFAPQLALGTNAPWLPRPLLHRSFPLADLRPGLNRAAGVLRRMEAVSRPRLTWLVSGPSQRLIGLICTVLAFVLILPIPLGNMLPAAAVTVLSLSLVQRDGLIALAGYALAAASAGVLVIVAHIVIKALQHFATALSAA